jgi:drug/metabolite transporter (DMT)-like permease
MKRARAGRDPSMPFLRGACYAGAADPGSALFPARELRRRRSKRGASRLSGSANREAAMNERLGVAAGILSCTLGGSAGVATRFLAATVEPETLAAFRFGLGFLVLLPLALHVRWPRGRDWIGVTLLGLLFFAVFFVLFNLAFVYTTAARGALALSALPLVTMALAAVLGVEKLSPRKTAGVVIAVSGVVTALGTGLAHAPEGAWRGDLIMAGATLCMALYSVRSRPYVARSSAMGFLVAGMGIGAGAIALIAAARGSLASSTRFHRRDGAP